MSYDRSWSDISDQDIISIYQPIRSDQMISKVFLKIICIIFFRKLISYQLALLNWIMLRINYIIDWLFGTIRKIAEQGMQNCE